jgi:hypothetical protein
MSNKITVVCDRCGKTINGMEKPGYYTAGFYRRDDFWGQFMNSGEQVLCDACMYADPRHRAEYPPPSPPPPVADLPE